MFRLSILILVIAIMGQKTAIVTEWKQKNQRGYRSWKWKLICFVPKLRYVAWSDYNLFHPRTKHVKRWMLKDTLQVLSMRQTAMQKKRNLRSKGRYMKLMKKKIKWVLCCLERCWGGVELERGGVRCLEGSHQKCLFVLALVCWWWLLVLLTKQLKILTEKKYISDVHD